MEYSTIPWAPENIVEAYGIQIHLWRLFPRFFIFHGFNIWSNMTKIAMQPAVLCLIYHRISFFIQVVFMCWVFDSTIQRPIQEPGTNKICILHCCCLNLTAWQGAVVVAKGLATREHFNEWEGRQHSWRCSSNFFGGWSLILFKSLPFSLPSAPWTSREFVLLLFVWQTGPSLNTINYVKAV